MKTKTLMAAALIACSSALLAQPTHSPSCLPMQGLVAYWPLDGTSQANALGGGFPALTVVGAAPSAGNDRFGVAGTCYTFDGLNDYIETSCPGILGTGPRAVSFWAKVPTARANVVSGVGMYVVAWGANGTGQRFGCNIDFQADETAIGGANCYQTFTSGNTVDDGGWHHYLFQYSGSGNFSNVEVYVDGVCTKRAQSISLSAGSTLNTVNTGAHNVHFGKTNYSTPNWFEGDLDDVAIWDRTLSKCEIRRLYDCTLCHSCCESARPAKNEGSHPEVVNPSPAIAQDVIMSSGKNVVVLNQNVPNPFAESTVISYDIPVNFSKAQLLFSDIDGNPIKTVDITEAGKGSVTVFADNLRQGVYSYRLVVDGKTVDTKKMIRE